MSIRNLSQYCLGSLAIVSLLAGCNGGFQSGIAPSVMTPTHSNGMPANSRGPFLTPTTYGAPPGIMARMYSNHGLMNPHYTSSGALLFVSDAVAGAVDIYGYKAGTVKSLVVTIFGFDDPQGMCEGKSKAAGTVGKDIVWITAEHSLQILGYIRGNTFATYVLNVFGSGPGYFPVGCSLDPKTGNLAVTDLSDANGGVGNVALFTPTDQAVIDGGPSKELTAPNIYQYYFLGYDNRGNLWVDGLDRTLTIFELAKCPPGCVFGKVATLNQFITFPGQVQWDNGHKWLEVNDPSIAFEFTVRGTTGSLAFTTPLKGSGDAVQTWLDVKNRTLIAPDPGLAQVEIYDYPAGGKPRQILTGFSLPIGSALLR